MICFPNAKINLGLQVVSRRTDGYHNLETVMYPTGWCDVLEVLESAETGFEVFGLTVPGNPADNLCLKAYSLVKSAYDIPPVHIFLQKAIPMGAGLGGGSADGAFMIKLLNQKFSLGISIEEMQQMAAKIGSDCAFFIENKASLATGRGNELTTFDLSLKGHYLLILYPGISVSTKEAYAGVSPSSREINLIDSLRKPIDYWKNEVSNDFEKSVFQLYPILSEIKETLYRGDALFAAMSGSGSAVFGIFDQEPDVKTFMRKDWKVWCETLA